MKKIFANTIILIITCSLVVIGIEITLRIIEPKSHGVFQQKSKNKNLAHEHMPNITVKILGRDVSINKDGYRGKYYNNEKGNNTLRIAIFGDSFTFGHGVSDEQTYAKQLENILQDNLSDKNVQVLNFGINDYSTEQELELFKCKGIEYTPDIVILGYYYNDAIVNIPQRSENKNYKKEIKKELSIKNIVHILRKSYCYKYLSPRINVLLRLLNIRGLGESGYFDKLYKENSKPWIRNSETLLEFKEIVNSINSDFIIVLLVDALKLDDNYPYKNTHKVVSEFCHINGIKCLDLYKELYGRNYTGYRASILDAHPDERLNKIFANEIFKFIKNENIIKNLN